MAVVTEAPTLAQRIQAALKRRKEPDPAKLVAVLRPTLTTDEEEDLIQEGLEERILNLIHVYRAKSFQAEEGRRLAAAAEREGTSAELRRRKEEYYENQTRELREAERIAMRSPLDQLQREVADRLRGEARRISLASIRGERVCVDGSWMMLENCNATHLHTLADEYVDRAVDQNVRGAYYRALAVTLEEGKFATVRDLCKGANQ